MATIMLSRAGQWKRYCLLSALVLMTLGILAERALADALPSWNEGPAKQAIIQFVRVVTDNSSPQYVPPEQRIAIVLRYTQGLSYDEIAEATGCSAGTVASRLNRAHRTLERRLARFRGKNGGPCV